MKLHFAETQAVRLSKIYLYPVEKISDFWNNQGKDLTDRNYRLYNIICIYDHVKTLMETVDRRHFRVTEKKSNAAESRGQVEARCK